MREFWELKEEALKWKYSIKEILSVDSKYSNDGHGGVKEKIIITFKKGQKTYEMRLDPEDVLEAILLFIYNTAEGTL